MGILHHACARSIALIGDFMKTLIFAIFALGAQAGSVAKPIDLACTTDDTLIVYFDVVKWIVQEGVVDVRYGAGKHKRQDVLECHIMKD